MVDLARLRRDRLGKVHRETAAREVIDQMVKQTAEYELPVLNIRYSGARGIVIP